MQSDRLPFGLNKRGRKSQRHPVCRGIALRKELRDFPHELPTRRAILAKGNLRPSLSSFDFHGLHFVSEEGSLDELSGKVTVWIGEQSGTIDVDAISPRKGNPNIAPGRSDETLTLKDCGWNSR